MPPTHGQHPNDPGSGPNKGVPRGGGSGCDCNNYTYEQGHPCFAECSGGQQGGDDDAWYEREIKSHPEKYDTNISKEQWIAWRSLWDDATKSFKSENVDADGNPIGGTGFEKPVDCPDGTTKYGQNQCLSLDDPRIQGAWYGDTGGGGGGGGAKAATPAAPASTGLAKDQLDYTGNELQDVLAQMFNFRAGIFGTGNPYLSSATPRTPVATGEGANKKPAADIAGAFLPGGGLWWGEKGGLTEALAPFAQTFSNNAAAAPAAAAPAKKKSSSSGTAPAIPVTGPITPPTPPTYPYPKGPKIRTPLLDALYGSYY